uniref:Uncharacterized protein n=1 Tax=Oryza brachyantha TaxID=4533 RepID=J3L4S3_ORYBR
MEKDDTNNGANDGANDVCAIKKVHSASRGVDAQAGQVYAHELFDNPLDPIKRRLVHEEQTANEGFGQVPRKPTNHSKHTGRDPYDAYSKRRACKGRDKFNHDEIKPYYIDGEEDNDDYYYED